MATPINYDYSYLLKSTGDGNTFDSWGFNYSSSPFSSTPPFFFSPTSPVNVTLTDDPLGLDHIGNPGGGLLEPHPNETEAQDVRESGDGQIWWTQNADFEEGEKVTLPGNVNGSRDWYFLSQFVSPADIWVQVKDDGSIDDFAYDYNNVWRDPVEPKVFQDFNGPFPKPAGEGWYKIIEYNEVLGDSYIKDPSQTVLPSELFLLSNTNFAELILQRTDGKLNISTSNGEFDLALGYPQQSNSFLICFLAGTRIAIPGGEKMIEDLLIGDLILTADGPRNVRFLSRSTHSIVACDSDSLPVCISANALSPGVPSEDLFISPGHSVVVDGSLVHASALVNGTNIRQLNKVEIPSSQFVYYNVELDKHHIITANGCPVESYFDIVPRSSFDNYSDYLAMYGSDEPLKELALPKIMYSRQLPASLRLKLQLQESTPVAV